MFRLQNEIVDVVRATRRHAIPEGVDPRELPDYLTGLQTPRALFDQPYPHDETIAFNLVERTDSDQDPTT